MEGRKHEKTARKRGEVSASTSRPSVPPMEGRGSVATLQGKGNEERKEEEEE
jgi:hypothetical protein